MSTTKISSRDAISLLKTDHRAAEKMFREFEEARDSGDAADKLRLARKLCTALLVSMEAKESVIYPAVRVAENEQGKLNGELNGELEEVLAWHGEARSLIARLGRLAGNDPVLDAGIRQLHAQVERHAHEEDHKLFASLKKSELDLEALANELEEARDRIRLRYKR